MILNIDMCLNLQQFWQLLHYQESNKMYEISIFLLNSILQLHALD